MDENKMVSIPVDLFVRMSRAAAGADAITRLIRRESYISAETILAILGEEPLEENKNAGKPDDD